MIVQQGEDLVAFAHYTSGGVGATGLVDVAVSVYEGTNSTAISTGSATEQTTGLYYYTLAGANNDANAVYLFVFQANDDTLDQKEMAVSYLTSPGVPVASSSIAAIAAAVWDVATSTLTSAGTIGKHIMDTLASATTIAAAVWDRLTSALTTSGSIGEYVLDKLAFITSGGVTVQAPLSDDGQTMTIIQGDDYNNADSRAFEWSSTGWPDITGATVTWTAVNRYKPSATVTKSLTIVSSGGATQTVRLELTAAETSALTPGNQAYYFDVQATLSGGNIVTLVSPDSVINVTQDRTDN